MVAVPAAPAVTASDRGEKRGSDPRFQSPRDDVVEKPD